LAAGVIDHVGFGCHERPWLQILHLGPNRHDPAGHFVAEHSRRLDVAARPVVPVEDVDIGATDGGGGNLDQNILARRFGDGDLVDLGARTGSGLDHCRHGRHGFILAVAKPVF
jgi:hypothetical protein